MNSKEWAELKKKEEILKKIAEIFRVEEKDVPKVTSRFLSEIKEMEEKLNA
jgi:alanyl-tRNA synthetase